MNSRNQLILSRVRLALKRLNQAAEEDEVLYDYATEVQDDIFLKCDIEKPFEIILLQNVADYDFAAENKLNIKAIEPSWGGLFEKVSQADWHKYKDITGNRPCYYSIFDQRMYVAPVPKLTTDKLIIKASQVKTIVPIDENVPPELPDIFDNVIVYGICKKYDQVFLGSFLEKLADAREKYDNPTEQLIVPDATW